MLDSPRRTFRIWLIAIWFELTLEDVKVPCTITARVEPSCSDNIAEWAFSGTHYPSECLKRTEVQGTEAREILSLYLSGWQPGASQHKRYILGCRPRLSSYISLRYVLTTCTVTHRNGFHAQRPTPAFHIRWTHIERKVPLATCDSAAVHGDRYQCQRDVEYWIRTDPRFATKSFGGRIQLRLL